MMKRVIFHFYDIDDYRLLQEDIGYRAGDARFRVYRHTTHFTPPPPRQQSMPRRYSVLPEQTNAAMLSHFDA